LDRPHLLPYLFSLNTRGNTKDIKKILEEIKVLMDFFIKNLVKILLTVCSGVLISQRINNQNYKITAFCIQKTYQFRERGDNQLVQ